MPVPKPTTKVDADELHNAMRRGALSQIAQQIVQTQVGFAIELPGMAEVVQQAAREYGIYQAAKRFLEACNATYALTFGAELPKDLRLPFETEFMKHTIIFLERRLNYV